MSRYNIQGSLGSAVAAAGTFTVSYPTGTNKGTFAFANNHGLVVAGQKLRPFVDFIMAAGTSSVTITNRTTASWPIGSDYVVSLDERGERGVTDEMGKNRVNAATQVKIVEVNLGAPATADADGISASQSVTAGVAALINGALASNGSVTFGTPRNVVAAWTGTAVATVTGVDEYGRAMVESSASGTSMAGLKAFKKVTRVTFSADVTGATVGSGDVLGLPVFLGSTAYITKELEDGAAATAGTTVVGATADPTATTGDVRGTYDPNSACDGSKVFRLWVGLTDPTFRGAEQYAG